MAMSMSQACERCWKRKQKCARDFPCLQCRIASRECVRRRQGSVVDPLDVSGDSYVEDLKARIAFLRTRVNDIGAGFGDNTGMTPANMSAKLPFLHVTSREPRDDMHSTIQEASYLSLSAMAERTDKQRSNTEGLSFQLLLEAAVAAGSKGFQNLPGINHRSDHFKAVGSFFATGPCEAAYQAYRHHLSGLYPYIAQKRLDEAYEHARDAHGGGTANARTSIPPEYVLVYLGLATGILLSPHYDHHEKDAEALIWCSLEAMNQAVDNGNDLPMVHCLIALTVCSLLSDKVGSTWHLLGLAMTRAVACGMHTVKHLAPDQEAEQAEHVRAVCALYLLDTWVSSALDRPFYLDSSTVTGLEKVTVEGPIAHLVSQARTLRTIRRSDRAEVLCKFIDLQHLHEITTNGRTTEKIGSLQSYATGLVEMYKHLAISHDPSYKMIVTETETIFAKYLTCFEDQLIAKAKTATSLEVLLIVAIGAIMCRLHASRHVAQQQVTYQAINILTLLSIRYSYARGLRDMLLECLMTSTVGDTQRPSERLRELTDKLEIQLPSCIEAIVFSKKLL